MNREEGPAPGSTWRFFFLGWPPSKSPMMFFTSAGPNYVWCKAAQFSLDIFDQETIEFPTGPLVSIWYGGGRERSQHDHLTRDHGHWLSQFSGTDHHHQQPPRMTERTRPRQSVGSPASVSLPPPVSASPQYRTRRTISGNEYIIYYGFLSLTVSRPQDREDRRVLATTSLGPVRTVS